MSSASAHAAETQPVDASTPPPTASVSLDPAELLATLMSTQLENGHLRAQLNVALQEIAELKLATARPSRSTGNNNNSNNNNSDPASVKLSNAISRIAKFGQLFYAPNIPEEAFGQGRPTFEHDHPDRYTDENHLSSRGYAADVYHLFPYKYHESIELSNTVKTVFFRALRTGISNSIERLRRSAGEIFGLPSEFFRHLDYPRATVPEIRRLLGVSTENGRNVFARFPPILFPEGSDGKMSYVFLNPALFRAARVIIYGDSFLSWTPESGVRLVLRSSGTYKHEDNRVIRTTSGLIAMIAVLVRYMLSPDMEFAAKGVGNVTRNDWFADHSFYRRLLLEGHSNGTPSIVRIFRQWDENVFPGSREQHGLDGDFPPDSEDDGTAAKLPFHDNSSKGIHGLLASMTLSDDSDSGSAVEAPGHLDPIVPPPGIGTRRVLTRNDHTLEHIDLIVPPPGIGTRRILTRNERTLEDLDPIGPPPDGIAADATVTLSTAGKAISARRTISSRPAISTSSAIAPVDTSAPQSAAESVSSNGPRPIDPLPNAAPARRSKVTRTKGVNVHNAITEAGPAEPNAGVAALPVRAGRKKTAKR